MFHPTAELRLCDQPQKAVRGSGGWGGGAIIVEFPWACL